MKELCHCKADDLKEKEKGEKILKKHISKYIKQVEKEAGVAEEIDVSCRSKKLINFGFFCFVFFVVFFAVQKS